MCVQGRGGGVLLVRYVVLVLTKHVVCGAIQFPPTATVGDRLVRPFYSAQWHSAPLHKLDFICNLPIFANYQRPNEEFSTKRKSVCCPGK